MSWLSCQKRSRERGFSLLEVLVSMVVLLVGLLGLASLAGTSINVSSHARAITQAVNLGNGKLQSLLAVGYNELHKSDNAAYVDLRRTCSLTDPSPTQPVYTCTPATPTTSLDNRDFTWRYTVTGIDLDSDGDADACRDRLKRVDVFVSWNDQLWHGPREMKFSSIRGRGTSTCALGFGNEEDDCRDGHDRHDDDEHHDRHDDDDRHGRDDHDDDERRRC